MKLLKHVVSKDVQLMDKTPEALLKAAQSDTQLRNRLLAKLKARSDLYKKPIPLADICTSLGIGLTSVEVQNLDK